MHDFTKNRLTECKNYKKVLESIILDNKSEENTSDSELRLLSENRLHFYCYIATGNYVFLFKKLSLAVKAFWLSDEIQFTKLNYAKSVLNKTIDEMQKIYETVSVEVIDTIENQYRETSKRTLKNHTPVDYNKNLNEINLYVSDYEEKQKIDKEKQPESRVIVEYDNKS
ncbi:22944_t:CDS:2, partial [Dentiscutata erythropus]